MSRTHIRSIEELGYAVFRDDLRICPDGVQFWTIRYPNSRVDVARLGIHDTGRDRDRLIVDYISMNGNPYLRVILGSPYASDVLLGFWVFVAQRSLRDLRVLHFVSVVETSLALARPVVYAMMSRELLGALTIEPRHERSFERVQRTKFGKMADHML